MPASALSDCSANDERQSAIARALETWFAKHGKDYPWRRTTDGYAILVSEIMLQQTQISTVLDRGYYERWMRQFPDIVALARAEESAVLKAWEGLGYYRRARNLQKLAQVVMAEHAGELPRTKEALLALPGIGPYTAGAVMSFAHDAATAIVDGNVARVLARLQEWAQPIDDAAGQKHLWDLAEALVTHAESPRRLNSAIMELGQTHCGVGSPACLLCPVKAWCLAKEPQNLPIKSRKTELTEVTERVFFLQRAGAILLEQETGPRRTGLWKLPALPPTPPPHPPILHTLTYGITRYRVTLHVHEAPTGSEIGKHQRLVSRTELADLALGSPYRRALGKVLATV